MVGFGNFGKDTAIALRDIGGANIIVCESDSK